MSEDKAPSCVSSSRRMKVLICLHILLLVYSLSGVFSKTAASQPFLSLPFMGLYGGMLLILCIYAIGWQQIIKRMPLTLAFMNKAVTIAWGILWGFLLFGEQVSAGKIVGAVLVIAGVVLFAKADTSETPAACDGTEGEPQ